AHELRAPILGVRAALSVFLAAVRRGDTGDPAILRRAISALAHLAAVSESLLTRTVEGRAPDVRPIDAVALVREATDAIELGRRHTAARVTRPPHAAQGRD